jgi:hypothetical protein
MFHTINHSDLQFFSEPSGQFGVDNGLSSGKDDGRVEVGIAGTYRETCAIL